MKPEHRKYILKHHDQHTAEQIAHHLNLKERTVQRYIDSLKTKDKPVGKEEAGFAPLTDKRVRPNWWLVLAVALVGFIFYANALQGEFIWDDNILIRNNTDIRSWSNLDKVLFGNLGGEKLYYKHSSFRPVQTITYMFDYSLWKMRPFGFHLTSIVCHLLVAVFLYLLVVKLFASNFIAFITAVLYVLHPVHTEAVTYIAGRADPLSSMFMLASLVFYFRMVERENILDGIGMGLCYLLGVLSRENGLMVPVFALMYHFAMRKKIPWKPFVIYGTIAVVYIILRKLEILGGMGLKEPTKTSVFERLPGFFVAYSSYFKLLVAPFHLHMEYLRPMFPWSDPRAVLGLLLFVATVAVAIWFRNRKPYVTFGILWFLVGLFPVSNTFVVVNAYMAEHWLYIPVMGLFLIIGHLFADWTVRNKAMLGPVVVIVAGLSLFFGVRTYQQNKTWLNQIAFYERTREFAPNSGRLHADLGEAYYRVGRIEDARDSTIRAIQLRPSYYAAWSNLGTIYMRLGETKKAIDAYEKSLKIRPNYFNAHFNLGNLYKGQQDFDKAIEHYQQAINYMPSLTQAYNNIAISYNQKSLIAKKLAETSRKKGMAEEARRFTKETKQFKLEAIKFYKKGIEIEPTNTKFYNNLASAYSDLGRHQEAEELYKKALALGGSAYDQAVIQYNLALGYHRLKDKKNFTLSFQNANSIPLQSAPVYQQLASIYAGAGLKKEATLLMQKAQQVQSPSAKGHP